MQVHSYEVDCLLAIGKMKDEVNCTNKIKLWSNISSIYKEIIT